LDIDYKQEKYGESHSHCRLCIHEWMVDTDVVYWIKEGRLVTNPG